MITVSEKALSHLCHSYGIKEADLSFLGGGREDSDGIAYSYHSKGQKKVLKILAFETPGTTELAALEERLTFVQYLGENGIDIAYPEKNESRRLYETFEDEKHIFLAYSMKQKSGYQPAFYKIKLALGQINGKSPSFNKELSYLEKHYRKSLPVRAPGRNTLFYQLVQRRRGKGRMAEHGSRFIETSH